MNSSDFIKLRGLIAKLNNEVNRAEREDGCFRKYYQHSAKALKDAHLHLQKLEQGLKTINYMQQTKF